MCGRRGLWMLAGRLLLLLLLLRRCLASVCCAGDPDPVEPACTPHAAPVPLCCTSVQASCQVPASCLICCIQSRLLHMLLASPLRADVLLVAAAATTATAVCCMCCLCLHALPACLQLPAAATAARLQVLGLHADLRLQVLLQGLLLLTAIRPAMTA